MTKSFFVFMLFCFVFLISLDGNSQQTDLKKLDETGLKTAFAQDDSAKALINLFYRKRESATWRGIIGLGLVAYSIRLASVDSYPGSYYVGPILFSPLYISGFIALIKYKQKNLLT